MASPQPASAFPDRQLPDTDFRGRQEAETPANARTRVHNITPRALLIGLLLVPAMCLWNEYTEIVAQATDLAAMSLPIAVVFGLVVLLVINLGLKKYAPRFAFSQAELLYIFVMQTVSIGVSGIGMMQFLNTTVANVFRYSTPENGWETRIQPFLKPWVLPDKKVLRGYYLGRSSIYNLDVLRGWFAPVLVWSLFIVVLLGVMLCINVLIRRQWMDRERLTFPIVALPLELTREGGPSALFTNRGLWIGFLIPAILESLASLNYLYPAIPFFPIKPSDPRLDLTPYMTTPPWNGMGSLTLSFYPLVIGLTYFLPLDVGFSLWFFYILTKMELVGATMMGFKDPGQSLAVSRMPYIGEQSAGAFLGIALFTLYGMRRYLWDIVRKAFSRRGAVAELNDDNEPMPYRWALFGTLAGGGALCAFGWALGMTWYVPPVFFLIYYLFVITFTRIRAEAGLPWGFGPDMNPHQVMTAGAGVRAYNTATLAGLASLMWFDLDYRCLAMPHQLEAMKLGESARMNNRHIAYAILLATAVAALASWWAVLTCYYQYGAASAHVNNWRTDMGKVPWNQMKDWLDNPAKEDLPRLQGVGVGFVMTAFLTAMRVRFTWWPFHPVGYAVAGTFTMPWLWCATFIGWLIKVIVIRYGGMKSYRRAIPFFIGLILGDYVTGSVWAIYGSITGVTTYRAFPI